MRSCEGDTQVVTKILRKSKYKGEITIIIEGAELNKKNQFNNKKFDFNKFI